MNQKVRKQRPAVTVALELGISAERVRRLIQAGVLSGEQVAGRWLVDDESVARARRSGIPDGKRLGRRPLLPAA